MPPVPPLDADAVLWTGDGATASEKPLLVLLHGYGADEQDLTGLAPLLPEAFAVASVRAPLTPPWPAPGYSWYPIEGLDSRDPAHVTGAAARLIEWIEALPHRTVGLLGFSQGAATAIQAMRLEPARFAFLVNLSGYATPGDLPGDRALADRRPPVFWGRGTRDDVIPDFLVAHTTQWLPEHTDLSGRVYQGLTHSISDQEVADVRAFLEKQLGSIAERAAAAD